jgi:VanZ family protein
LAIFSIQLDPLTEGHWNHIVRKCGHVGEYAILAVLAARVFRGSSHARLRRWWWIWSLAVVVVFASTDEYHQTFVPGREGQVQDVALDSAGGAAALALLAIGRSIWFGLRAKPVTETAN